MTRPWRDHLIAALGIDRAHGLGSEAEAAHGNDFANSFSHTGQGAGAFSR